MPVAGSDGSRAARTGASAVLVLADVDGWQEALGTGSGTEALGPDGPGRLRELARIFDAELRRHDRIFRIDGTLFALLLTGGWKAPEAEAVTVRLAARLSGTGPAGGALVSFGTAALGHDGAPGALRRAGRQLLEARAEPSVEPAPQRGSG